MEKQHTEKCKSNGINQATGEKVVIPSHCTCDEYHTFDELYDHRITLFIALCKQLISKINVENVEGVEISSGIGNDIWRSKRHSNGELCFGTGTQYILGINTENGEQISYHIPIERWEETNFVRTFEIAPDFDGHTPNDVLERIKRL